MARAGCSGSIPGPLARLRPPGHRALLGAGGGKVPRAGTPGALSPSGATLRGKGTALRMLCRG